MRQRLSAPPKKGREPLAGDDDDERSLTMHADKRKREEAGRSESSEGDGEQQYGTDLRTSRGGGYTVLVVPVGA